MEFLKRSLLLLAIFMAFLCSSQGYVFYVGGKQGWSANPSEDYVQWAERNRFQVNDTLGESLHLCLLFGLFVFCVFFFQWFLESTIMNGSVLQFSSMRKDRTQCWW